MVVVGDDVVVEGAAVVAGAAVARGAVGGGVAAGAGWGGGAGGEGAGAGGWVAGVPEPCTTTVPVIDGWMLQWYENVPGCPNVWA